MKQQCSRHWMSGNKGQKYHKVRTQKEGNPRVFPKYCVEGDSKPWHCREESRQNRVLSWAEEMDLGVQVNQETGGQDTKEITAAHRGGASSGGLQGWAFLNSCNMNPLRAGEGLSSWNRKSLWRNTSWNFSGFYENDVPTTDPKVPMIPNDPQRNMKKTTPRKTKMMQPSYQKQYKPEERRIKISTKRKKKIIYLEFYIQGKYLSEIEATL